MRSILAKPRVYWAAIFAVTVWFAPVADVRAAETGYADALRPLAERLHGEADAIPNDVNALADSVVTAQNSLNRLQGELAEAGLSPAVYEDFLTGARERIRKAKLPGDVRGELERVALRLDAMAGGVPDQDATPRSLSEVQSVRDILVEELSGRAYTQSDDMRQALMELIRSRLKKWSDVLFQRDILRGVQRISFYIMVSLLFVLIGALAFLYVRRVASRHGRRAGREDGSAVHTRRMAHPEDYRREAEQLATAGQYREALRAQFLRILAELEAGKLVAFDRTRTNSEYVSQLQRRLGASELVRVFTLLTRRYNAAWYGHEACTAEMYSEFDRGAARTVQLVQAVQ